MLDISSMFCSRRFLIRELKFIRVKFSYETLQICRVIVLGVPRVRSSSGWKRAGANKLPVSIISIRGTCLFLFSSFLSPSLSLSFFLLFFFFSYRNSSAPWRSSPFPATRVHTVHTLQTGLRFVKAGRACSSSLRHRSPRIVNVI